MLASTNLFNCLRLFSAEGLFIGYRCSCILYNSQKIYLYNYGLILRISVVAHGHLFSAPNWVHTPITMHGHRIMQSDCAQYANTRCVELYLYKFAYVGIINKGVNCLSNMIFLFFSTNILSMTEPFPSRLN